jgi:hypothetical protein
MDIKSIFIILVILILLFLIKILSQLTNKTLKPKIKNNRIIEIKFDYLNNLSLYFRDSLLLLPTSIKVLAINFKVVNNGIFPYNFVYSSIPLDYIGEIPEIKYFDKVNSNEYNNYKNSFISFLEFKRRKYKIL